MMKPIPLRLLKLPGWQKLTLFQQSVLFAVYSIPKGEVRTYKQVAQWAARMSGVKRYALAFRAVGSVMRKNPYAPLVPCHRVIKSDGTLGAYSGKGGKAGKKRMLEKEGAARSVCTQPVLIACMMPNA